MAVRAGCRHVASLPGARMPIVAGRVPGAANPHPRKPPHQLKAMPLLTAKVLCDPPMRDTGSTHARYRKPRLNSLAASRKFAVPGNPRWPLTAPAKMLLSVRPGRQLCRLMFWGEWTILGWLLSNNCYRNRELVTKGVRLVLTKSQSHAEIAVCSNHWRILRSTSDSPCVHLAHQAGSNGTVFRF